MNEENEWKQYYLESDTLNSSIKKLAQGCFQYLRPSFSIKNSIKEKMTDPCTHSVLIY